MHKRHIRNNTGFTLVELIVTLLIFIVVIASASQVFTALLTQFKQQGKMAETNIEGIIGLEVMRRDIANAGYGLPLSWTSGAVSYTEATDHTALNDSGMPRAAVLGNNTGFNDSDILAIKGFNLSTNDTSKKWAHVWRVSWTSTAINRWGTSSSDNLSAGDKIIVINPLSSTNPRQLVLSGTSFWTTFGSTLPSDYLPVNQGDYYIIYGLTNTGTPRMPFNRSDYYIGWSTSTRMPVRCAPHTGILYRGTVINDSNPPNTQAGHLAEMPILDCVADMQVIFGLDMTSYPAVSANTTMGTFTDGNAVVSSGLEAEGATPANVLSVMGNAKDLASRLKEIRVYILSHEGQKDVNYAYPNSSILVGDSSIGASVFHNFDLAAVIGSPEYKYYRWKIYTLVIQPDNLR